MLISLTYIFIYPGKVTDGKSLISHEQMNESKLDVYWHKGRTRPIVVE